MRLDAREYLKRAVLPRLVVAATEVRWPRKALAGLKELAGRPPRIELYFAFDDPYSALALPGLRQIAARRRCELTLYPLPDHGIEGDPSAELRRRYAIRDSHRLAERLHLPLVRTEPVRVEDAVFLAVWAEGARPTGRMEEFCAAAIQKIWGEAGAISPREFQGLYEKIVGERPPSQQAILQDHLRENLRRLRRKGHWESPAAWVEGEWFFAHERLEQIEDRLQYLGS